MLLGWHYSKEGVWGMAEEVSIDERKAVSERLRKSPVRSDSVPLFLLEQYKDVAEKQAVSLGVLDGKAVAQIGFAGTAVALFTALGHISALQTGWIATAFIALIASIICCVVALWIQRRNLPTFDCYMLNRTLKDESNKGAIAAEIAGSWGDFVSEVQGIASWKSKWIRSAMILFVIGIGFLALAFVLN
jgi:hypothetical protein